MVESLNTIDEMSTLIFLLDNVMSEIIELLSIDSYPFNEAKPMIVIYSSGFGDPATAIVITDASSVRRDPFTFIVEYCAKEKVAVPITKIVLQGKGGM